MFPILKDGRLSPLNFANAIFPSRCLKHNSEVACDLRNNHIPTTAYERCPNQLQTGSGTPLEKKKNKKEVFYKY